MLHLRKRSIHYASYLGTQSKFLEYALILLSMEVDHKRPRLPVGLEHDLHIWAAEPRLVLLTSKVMIELIILRWIYCS
jgi:hypothetical protein